MRGIFTKDMEILKANVKTFAAVYVIALVCLVLLQVRLFLSAMYLFWQQLWH